MERTALIAELEKHAQYLWATTVLDANPRGEKELRDVRAFLDYLRALPVGTTSSVQALAVSGKTLQKPAQRVRCPFYKSIRRVFAICKERGLDTKADDAMRRAFENFLVRPVPSRDALTGRDWDDIGTAIERGELAW